MKPQIIEIQKENFHKELTTNSIDFEHVLVYDNGGILHAVHVDKMTKFKKVICENSSGPKDPDVKVALDDVLNLYRVHCTAEKILLPERKPKEASKTSATSTSSKTTVYEQQMMSNSRTASGKISVKLRSRSGWRILCTSYTSNIYLSDWTQAQEP